MDVVRSHYQEQEGLMEDLGVTAKKAKQQLNQSIQSLSVYEEEEDYQGIADDIKKRLMRQEK